MESFIFWDITPYGLLKVNRRFGEKRPPRLQGRIVSRARNKRESRWQAELFEPDDESDVFLRNFDFQRHTRSYIPEDRNGRIS
jgi:hypothetical protein